MSTSSYLGSVTIVTLATVLVGCGCNKTPPPVVTPIDTTAPTAADTFEDVTGPTGIEFTYRNGEESGHYAIMESLGGGVALIDFDRDGKLDLFIPGGGSYDGPEKQQIKGHPSRLYRNLGDWKFKDVTSEIGLDQPLFYTHGAAVADYDADGWPDLLVTGYGRIVLYRNEANGTAGRRFRDVTDESGLKMSEHFWATSAAFGDLDGDGLPELYLCQYVNWSVQNNPKCNGYTTNVERDVCPPKQFDAVPHRLYRNLGADKDGKTRFADVSAEAGLRVPPRKDGDYGKGLGVLFVDLNADGKPDIYVANDTTDNFLYVNESQPGKLRFRECGFESLCARDSIGTPNGSMGVDAADYNGTGQPSIWVTNYEGELHALYRNVSRGPNPLFSYSTQSSGIAAIGQNYVGFGTSFVDVDQDGWEDIVVSNGHVIRHPYRAGLRQKPVLLRNQGNGMFTDVTAQGGPYFRTEHRGRGLVAGDLDNDGRPDLVISHVNEPITVLRHKGTSNHWIGLELTRPDGRDVAGARITILAGARKFVRFVKGGGSYLSAGDRRILIGLGDVEKIDKVEVQWPWSEPRAEPFDPPAVGKYWRLTKGNAAPKAIVP